MIQELSEEQIIELAKKSRWFGVNKEDVDQGLISHSIVPKKEKDEIAYNDPIIRLNFRRGLTFIQQIKDFKRVSLKIARKGLRKFEYLYPQFLDQNAKTGKHLSKLKDQFLNSVDRFKGTYVLNVLQKANGQNCQISFSNDRWVICSKNRVLFVKDAQSIPWKDKYIYGFRLEIAELWFQILNKMTHQQVEQLKKQLQTKTFIGEYCDSINHQHIVKYSERQILFYAIVQKYSTQNCLPVLEAFKIFEHFGLKRARIYINKQASSPQQLYSILYQIYKNVSKASIEQVGEGGVIYIEGIDNKTSKLAILSLWKIKSISYLLLRRLREKLSQYLKKYRKSTKTMLRKVIEDIKQMAETYKTQQQIQFYIKLAQKSFKLVENGSNLVLKFVLHKFISFLDFAHKQQLKPVEEFDQMIKGVSKQLETIQREQQKSDQQNEKQKSDQEQCGQDSKQSKVIQKKNQKFQLKSKRIIILIPITIPSSGKSVCFNSFVSNKDLMVEIVSSDKCREQAMNQLRNKNKQASHQTLFDKSAKNAKALFTKYLSKAFNSLQASDTENCLLILDKNHPPSGIQSTYKQLNSIIGKNKKDVKIVALIPECKDNIYEKGKYSFPFSTDYIITCLKRIIARQVHQTVIGTANQKCNVLIGFITLYRGYRFNKYNLSKFFDSVLQIRMHNHEIQGVSKQLEQRLIKIIAGKKPGDFTQSPLIYDIIEMLKEVKITQIPLQELYKQNIFKIMELFSNFQNMELPEDNYKKQ